LCLALAGTGCAVTAHPSIIEGDVLTYYHPFTDAAAQAVQQNAAKVCAERRQAAEKTRSTCSLAECTTHYQCMGGTAK
jgi:hypothetical protein